jgi:dihydroorotate dehydrogenase
MYRLIRNLLFQLDAEDAHELASKGMIALQRIPPILRAIEARCAPPPSAARSILGMTFPSPIGIAAGFDKSATMMPMLAALGFGFIEVGTVTLKPQPGNPRPRLFRYPREQALINRMGFNNDGADVVARRLAAWRSGAAGFSPPGSLAPGSLPPPSHGGLKPAAPLFVNVGKNGDVPLEAAVDDYAACAAILAPHADAVVVNLSSPNTPGLRELQRPEHLEPLLRALRGAKPLLVKIAPDIDDDALLGEICDVCTRFADGMVCTNTTTDRPFPAPESGGLSGKPLLPKSTAVLARVRERVGPGYPLIGVGGIFTADDMRAKLAAGADLVQVYTGFVFEGPGLPRRLARAVGS